MTKLITSLVVWIIVFGLTVILTKLLGASELMQGSFGAILAINVDRLLFD